MAEVIMRCVDGPFAGLEFTVPDKTPFQYEVVDPIARATYAEATRSDIAVEVRVLGG